MRPQSRIGARDHAAADEGELRGLADDAADRRRIAAGGGAVEHHLGDRELAFERLAARLEIDRAGEAMLLGAARCRGGVGLVDEQIGARAARAPRRRRAVMAGQPAGAAASGAAARR